MNDKKEWNDILESGLNRIIRCLCSGRSHLVSKTKDVACFSVSDNMILLLPVQFWPLIIICRQLLVVIFE